MTLREAVVAGVMLGVAVALASTVGVGLVALVLIVGVFAIVVFDHRFQTARERTTTRRERLKRSARRG